MPTHLSMASMMMIFWDAWRKFNERMIYKAGKYDSISEKREKLRLVPLWHRIIFTFLALTFRCLNVTAPPYLSRLVSRYKTARGLISAALGKLTVSLTRLKYCGRSFFIAVPTTQAQSLSKYCIV